MAIKALHGYGDDASPQHWSVLRAIHVTLPPPLLKLLPLLSRCQAATNVAAAAPPPSCHRHCTVGLPPPPPPLLSHCLPLSPCCCHCPAAVALCVDAAATLPPSCRRRHAVALPPPLLPLPLPRRLLVGCCIVVRRPISSLHAVMRPLTLSLPAAFADNCLPPPPPPPCCRQAPAEDGGTCLGERSKRSILVSILLSKEPSLFAGLSQQLFTGTGILQNPEESGGFRGKYRNSWPQEFLQKILLTAKKTEFLRPFQTRVPVKNSSGKHRKKETSGILAGTFFFTQKTNS